jgi:glutaredoxin
MQQENLADIIHKLSIIYKHIQLMHNELKYQAKTYIISEKLSKEKDKNSASSPQIFFFSLETNK